MISCTPFNPISINIVYGHRPKTEYVIVNGGVM